MPEWVHFRVHRVVGTGGSSKRDSAGESDRAVELVFGLSQLLINGETLEMSPRLCEELLMVRCLKVASVNVVIGLQANGDQSAASSAPTTTIALHVKTSVSYMYRVPR